jgi:hypothetical protein
MSVRYEVISVAAESVAGINCDNCQEDIPQVFPQLLKDGPPRVIEGPQGNDMLHVTLAGGYGELLDGGADVHLCKKCAEALQEAFPLFKKVIRRTCITSPDWRDDEYWEKEGYLNA